MPNPKGTARIPRRNSSALMQLVRLESPDAKTLLREILNTCLIDKEPDKFWRTNSINMICNPDLNRRYDLKKKAFKEQGRKSKEIEERLVFDVDSWATAQNICKKGISCKETHRHVLGDSKYGLHLNRNYDVLLRYMTFKKYSGVQFIIVFKVMFGKVKTVVPTLGGETGCIEPTPNFDCHVSNSKPDMEMGVRDAQDHNYVYVYEYDDETAMPCLSPAQILPCALIGVVRTEEQIQKPLVWTRTKAKQKQKRSDTCKNEQKVVKTVTDKKDCSVSLKSSKKTTETNFSSDPIAEISIGQVNPRLTCLKQLLLSPVKSTANIDISAAPSVINGADSSNSVSNLQNTGYEAKSSIGLSSLQNTGYEAESSIGLFSLQNTEYEAESSIGLSSLQNTGYLLDTSNISSISESDSSQGVSKMALSMSDKVIDMPCILPEIDSKSPGMDKDKSFIIRRLREVEKEIENKKKKLKELRMCRELANGNIVGEFYQDMMSDKNDDIETITVLRMKKEPGEQDNCDDQPLDLSKSKCQHAEELKTDVLKKDESVMNDFPKLNIPVSSPTSNIPSTTKEVAAGADASQTDSTKSIKQEIDSGPPTPTLDEIETDYRNIEEKVEAFSSIEVIIDKSQHVTPSCPPQSEIPVISLLTNPKTKEQNRVSVNASKAVNKMHTTKESVITTSASTNKTLTVSRQQEEMTLKKPTSFFEKYIEKKQALGQNFTQTKPMKAISSVDASKDFLPLCTTIKQEKELPFHPKIVSVTSLAAEMNESLTRNEMSSEKDTTNARQKNSSYDCDFAISNSRLQKQMHENRDDVGGTDNETAGQLCEKNKLPEDKEIVNNSSDLVTRNSPIQTASELVCRQLSGSNYNNADNDANVTETTVLTCKQENGDNKNVTKSNGDCVESKHQSRPIDEVSAPSKSDAELPIPDNLSSQVAKTLQDLGTAIDRMKKQFQEPGEGSGDSLSGQDNKNPQNEEKDCESSVEEDINNIQMISTIVTTRTPEEEKRIGERNTAQLDTIIDQSTEEMYWNTSKMYKDGSVDEGCETNVKHINNFKDLVQKQYDVLRQNTKQASNTEDPDSAISQGGKDVFTSEDIDFKPRNMGFSSYLPEAKHDQDSNNVTQSSELLLQDVSSIKSEIKVETCDDTECIKQESEVGPVEQHAIEKLEVKKVYSKKNIWRLRKNIKRNLIEIRQMSTCAEDQEVLSRRKLRKMLLKRSRSRSQEKNTQRRKRTRSRSDSLRCSSRKRHRVIDTRPRSLSPIRDPNFIPFLDKGKIITQYFREQRRKKMRFKKLKSSVQNKYRKKTVRKARKTLARNLVTKPFRQNTVVKRRVLLPTPNIKPEPISSFETNTYESVLEGNSSRERRRSLSGSRGNQSDYDTSTRRSRPINRDQLIFDRFGNEIKLDTPQRRANRYNRYDSRENNVELNRLRRNSSDRTVDCDRRIVRRRSIDRTTERDRFITRRSSERFVEADQLTKRRSSERVSELQRFPNRGNSERHDQRDRRSRLRRSEDRTIDSWREITRRSRKGSSSPERVKSNKTDEIDNTLSKAMTTLFKRILFDGHVNDNSAEGKMADMVFEMVKKKVTSTSSTDDRPESTQSRQPYSPTVRESVSRQNGKDFDADSYWRQENESYFKRVFTDDNERSTIPGDESTECRYWKNSNNNSEERYYCEAQRDSVSRHPPRWRRDNEPLQKPPRTYNPRDQSYSPDRCGYRRSYSPPDRFQSGEFVSDYKYLHRGSYYNESQPFAAEEQPREFRPSYFQSNRGSYMYETNTSRRSRNTFRSSYRGSYNTNRPFTNARGKSINSEDGRQTERKTDERDV